jgi:alkylated DNA repair dioxygenase AlkB
MDLFNQNIYQNILPYDGTAIYFGKIMSAQNANNFLEILLNTIEWKNDEAIIFGNRIVTKRKAAWYANTNFAYTYSNTTKYALPFTSDLIVLKKLVEDTTQITYNSCLLNLYHNGSEGMAYHSDDEASLVKHQGIASVSFGAERKFLFKHKQTKETIAIVLEAGSLLLMKDVTQSHWLHRLPPTKKIMKPRVNLTFRTMAIQ